MKEKTTRLNFTLPASLHEKVRKQAYIRKVHMSKIVIAALEQFLKKT